MFRLALYSFGFGFPTLSHPLPHSQHKQPSNTILADKQNANTISGSNPADGSVFSRTLCPAKGLLI